MVAADILALRAHDGARVEERARRLLGERARLFADLRGAEGERPAVGDGGEFLDLRAEALRLAGIDDGDSEGARQLADAEAVAAALRFAERRRLGPFAAEPNGDPRERQKAIAAMVRAGHGFALARKIVAMRPGEAVDVQNIMEQARLVLP